MKFEGIPFEVPDTLTVQQMQFLKNYLYCKNAMKAARLTWTGPKDNPSHRYRSSSTLVSIVDRIENPGGTKAKSVEWQLQQLTEVAENKKGGAARVQAINAIRRIMGQDKDKDDSKDQADALPDTLMKRIKEEKTWTSKQNAETLQ